MSLIEKTQRKPTETGIEQYPPDGLYENMPCTCRPNCWLHGNYCKGDCGCPACAAAYDDSIDDLDY